MSSGSPPPGPAPDSPHHQVTAETVRSVVQAGAVHGGVHIHTTPPVPAPFQSLPPPAHFLNRERELQRLSEILHEAQDAGSPVIAVLTGIGGVGKSALARSFLHATRQDVDGQLYAAFTDRESTTPSDVVLGFLRALGQPDDAIPATLGERAALFRSLTSDRRMAILLENVATAAQARALLPGQGPHVVVVTSRLRLTGLVFEGARILDVPPLQEDEAVRLLGRVVGPERVRSEADAARRIVAVCDRMPIAVCAAAAGALARSGHSLHTTAAELARDDRRLDLVDGDEGQVRRAFEFAYRSLDHSAARLHRLCGAFPGPHLSLEAAAELLDLPAAEARGAVELLVGRHLLDEVDAGRYQQHGLVRLHARERAAAEETAAEIRAALVRASAHYLRVANEADQVLRPYSDRHADPAPATWFTDRAAALAWLDRERATLAALLEWAAENGREQDAFQLSSAMWPLFQHRRYLDLWLATDAVVLRAAERLGDHDRRARVRNRSALALLDLGRAAEAEQELRAAQEICRRHGNTRRLASATRRRGVALAKLGRHPEAITELDRAREQYRALGRWRDVGRSLLDLAEVLEESGSPELATRRVRAAFTHIDAQSAALLHTRARLVLGRLRIRKRPDEAQAYLRSALAAFVRLDMVPGQAEATEALGELAWHRGDTSGARDQWSRALSLFTWIGARGPAARLRDRLRTLPGWDGS